MRADGEATDIGAPEPDIGELSFSPDGTYAARRMVDDLEIECPNCSAAYRVGFELAGHRVQCARCSERFEAGAAAGGDPPEPAGRLWRFRMPGGQRFGPLSKPELDEYLDEGIITAECQIHCEGKGDWRWAAEVYPDVPEFQSKASRNSGATAALSGGLPSAGLLERIPSIRDRLPAENARAHGLLDARIEKEAQESDLGLRSLGSRSIGLVQSVIFGRQFSTNFGASLPSRSNVLVNSLAVAGMAVGLEEFYLVTPFSNLEPLPHEFFALLPGELPTAMVLRAGSGATPVWLGEDRSSQGAVATAMKHLQSPLGTGANWKWASKDKKLKLSMEWGVQLVPLGSEQFAVIAQTAGIGRKGKLLGLDWFAQQIHHARRLRAKLNIPGGCEAHFPFHSESAELIARMFGDE